MYVCIVKVGIYILIAKIVVFVLFAIFFNTNKTEGCDFWRRSDEKIKENAKDPRFLPETTT
jgi:hypothetical protein